MTKEEIEEALEFYKKDFFIRTGMELLVVPINIKTIPLERIVDCGLEFFNLKWEEVIKRNRTRPIVKARNMMWKVAHQNNYTISNIGRAFRKDHTTVIHGLRTFSNLYDTEEDYRSTYDQFSVFTLDKAIKLQELRKNEEEERFLRKIMMKEVKYIKSGYSSVQKVIEKVA